MKKKLLFENVGGNTFKMLSENTEAKPVHESVVASGLRKVFENAKGDISYKTIESVGFGYIKNLTEARNTALKEARILAKEFNFTENEDLAKFQKGGEVERPAGEETEEIEIANNILNELSVLHQQLGQEITKSEHEGTQLHVCLKKIEDEARRLLKIHGKQ